MKYYLLDLFYQVAIWQYVDNHARQHLHVIKQTPSLTVYVFKITFNSNCLNIWKRLIFFYDTWRRINMNVCQ